MTSPPPELWSLVESYVLVLAGLVLYAALANRLRAATQPIRLKFATLGQVLVATKLPEKHRHFLEIALDEAYNGWTPWLVAAMAPVSVLLVLFKAVKPLTPPGEGRLADYWNLTVGLWLLSIMGLSPLAGLIITIEFLLLAIFVFPFIGAQAFLAGLPYVIGRIHGHIHRAA